MKNGSTVSYLSDVLGFLVVNKNVVFLSSLPHLKDDQATENMLMVFLPLLTL